MGKREDILEATRDLIAEEGLHSASFPKIFARAGVGSGTLYNYFASKEVLVMTLYREISARMDSEVLADYDATASIKDRFEALMRNLFRFVSARWKDLAVLDACRHLPALAEEKRQSLPPSAVATYALLDEGRAQNIFLPLDPLAASLLVMGAIRAVVEGQTEGKLPVEATDWTIAACWRALVYPEKAGLFPLPVTAASGTNPSLS